MTTVDIMIVWSFVFIGVDLGVVAFDSFAVFTGLTFPFGEVFLVLVNVLLQDFWIDAHD